MGGHRRTVAVAFSGGRDSLALLHATTGVAATLGLEVVALHVNHGLVPGADDWVRSAQRLCARWRARGRPVRLLWRRLEGTPAKGESVEAWARRGRYAALHRMATECGASIILLAQHRRDQAETFLLQALRGGGPRALAGMPRTIEREGVTWSRPWITQPRATIDAYIERYRLRPIEDPSNADARWARNRLRARVWAPLLAAFPDAEQVLCASAMRAAEASAALAELAVQDLDSVADGAALAQSCWLQLSPARRALVLRAWLAEGLPAGVPESLVQRLLQEWPAAVSRQWPVDVDRELRAYRGRLEWVTIRGRIASAAPIGPLDLSSPGDFLVPSWEGHYEIRPTDSGGVEPGLLRTVELRMRRGGEQFQRALKTPPRSLKKQYQAAGIPESDRSGPLAWSGEQLLHVPGLGVDARALATTGRPQLTMRWVLHRSS
jgi:tRNA(Ile)-lysidine synthase